MRAFHRFLLSCRARKGGFGSLLPALSLRRTVADGRPVNGQEINANLLKAPSHVGSCGMPIIDFKPRYHVFVNMMALRPIDSDLWRVKQAFSIRNSVPATDIVITAGVYVAESDGHCRKFHLLAPGTVDFEKPDDLAEYRRVEALIETALDQIQKARF